MLRQILAGLKTHQVVVHAEKGRVRVGNVHSNAIGYATIDVADVAKMKDYLASGYAIYFAIDVDNLTTMQNSVWNGPFDGSAPGGHAMVIVGYDDNLAYTGGTGAFKVLNSWGTTWGANGFFWLTYNWWLTGVSNRASASTIVFMPTVPNLAVTF